MNIFSDHRLLFGLDERRAVRHLGLSAGLMTSMSADAAAIPAVNTKPAVTIIRCDFISGLLSDCLSGKGPWLAGGFGGGFGVTYRRDPENSKVKRGILDFEAIGGDTQNYAPCRSVSSVTPYWGSSHGQSDDHHWNRLQRTRVQ